MLKYSTFCVTLLNIYLARKVVILLLISGTLITSIAVTGQTFATTIGKPDIGIDDGLTTEGEDAEDEETTEEDGEETTSERAVPSKDRFCKQGTGGDTGKPCIPCDPGLPIPGCMDITTGGPLIQGEGDETEPEDGGVMSTDTIEELMGSNDTEKKVETIFQDLENKGEIPPKTTEAIESFLTGNSDESLNALGTLCDIATANITNDAGTVDCDTLEVSGGESGLTTIDNRVLLEGAKIIAEWMLTNVLDPKAVDFEGMAKWCIQNPGKCT